MAEHEQIVGQRADDRAHARRDHRDPPPAAGRRKHAAAPSSHCRKQPRPEIARGIDRIAGVEAKGDADRRHDAADDHGRQPLGVAALRVSVTARIASINKPVPTT